jgi:hypothetical protein
LIGNGGFLCAASVNLLPPNDNDPKRLSGPRATLA